MSQQLHNELQKLFKQCCKKFLVFHSRALISQISKCAKYNSWYIGETCRHLQTRIDEQMRIDKKLRVYKHLHEECFNSFNFDSFSIIDKVQVEYKLKIKECMYINWEKPNLNKEFNHLAATLSIGVLYISVIYIRLSYISVICQVKSFCSNKQSGWKIKEIRGKLKKLSEIRQDQEILISVSVILKQLKPKSFLQGG